MATRLIAHLDMDAFYASVELLRYPQLRGQPVVIGGRRDHHPEQLADGTWRYARLRDYVGRGVITTSTYEARALGVHSGMGMMKASALAPEAILLPVDFDAYRHYSRLFKAAVLTIAPVMEDRGIDEIYLDLTDVPGVEARTPDDPWAGVREVAQRIKDAVKDATGLSCSIGITPNKLLAKLCSDLEKPNGLTVLMAGDIESRIWPLPVKRINGIGPKATERLHELGIQTIGELAGVSLDWLIEHFGGNYGQWLFNAARGHDDRPVVTYREAKSMSRETTFERDLHPKQDRERLGQVFTKLCEQVAADLLRKGYVGRTVGIKLRDDAFKTVTRSVTLPQATRDAATIRHWAGQCLKTVPLDRRLRLLGVKVESLQKGDAPEPIREKEPQTLPLFDGV